MSFPYSEEGTSAVHDVLISVNEQWDRIVERAAPVVRKVRIAETDIEIALAGEELAEILLPGFECHAPAIGVPRAVVGAWDAEATGFPLPSPLRPDHPLVRQWIVRRAGRPMAELDWSEDAMVRVGNRYVDRHLLGVARAAALSPWEAGAPLRRGLWWALGPEALFVHAGAVATSDGAALIMGASGSGKSTTSLACLRAGMGFLGDDYCLVRDDPPVVHLLAATARVHHHELAHLDQLAAVATSGRAHHAEDASMKALLYLDRVAADQLVSSAPVRVIVMPEPTDESAPRLVRLRPAQALRAAAPAALWQMHIEADRELEGLRKLVTAVPTFRLLLSRNRDENPKAVQEAISQSVR